MRIVTCSPSGDVKIWNLKLALRLGSTAQKNCGKVLNSCLKVASLNETGKCHINQMHVDECQIASVLQKLASSQGALVHYKICILDFTNDHFVRSPVEQTTEIQGFHLHLRFVLAIQPG